MNVIWEGTAGYLANLQVGEQVRFTYYDHDGNVWLMAQRGEDSNWHRLNRVLASSESFLPGCGLRALLLDVEVFAVFIEGSLERRKPCCVFSLEGELLTRIDAAIVRDRWSLTGVKHDLESYHWVLHFEVVEATD